MRFYFVTPVWGPNHLSLFLNVGLPSLLAPGNIPALAQPSDCRFLIYTRAREEEELRLSPAFQALAKLMPVDVFPIPDPIVDAHRVMSNCHADALRRVDEADAAAVFVPPDCVWSNGSMAALERIARSGKSMIHISGIRLNRDSVVPVLQTYRANGALDIDAQTLVSIGLQHLHPIVRLHFWREHENGLMPANLYWTVPGEGLLLRCFHLHPLFVKPQVKFAQFKSTIDDDLALTACPDEAGDYVVTDSDEILTFELSGPERVIGGDFVKESIESVAAWMEIGTNARHHLLARYLIRIHSGPMTEALWREIEHESDEVIGKALAIGRLSSSELALRFPAVLPWRYYAMTLNRGRYRESQHRFARFSLRVWRRVVHGNRFVRAIFIDRYGSPRPWHPSRLFVSLGSVIARVRRSRPRPLNAAVQTRNAEASPLSRSPRPARPLRLIDPLEASKHQRRADTKRQLGQMAAALRYYDRAMELSPDNTVLRYLRGTARLEVGDITGAIEDLGAAVTLDPTNKQLGELLAYAQARSRSGRPLADPPHYLTSVPPPWTFHLFARNGDIRFAHPKWLVYRRGLATLAQCITPDVRSVFLLGDHGFFRDHLLRQFPHLHVESFAPLPGPVSSRVAAFPAQLNQWDMVVYVGFNVPLDERGVDLLSTYRRPETRVIAIVADARYADELRVPGVEIQLLQEKGTLFCYRTYQRMALGRARLYRRLARVPLPLKFIVPPVIATIALGTLVAGIAANTAGLAINRWSVARSSTRTKTFSLPVPGANKLRNPTVESRADNIEEPIRAQSRP